LLRRLSQSVRLQASSAPVSPAQESVSVPALKRKRTPRLGLGVKRWLDVSLGIVIGAIALPLMLVIAAAIVVDSPGPVLFRPMRIGRRGKHFAMYKFRTMVKDAHQRLDELAHLNVADGMVKIPDDPRVTRMGKWLRRFSLDELPQIFNIIAGHMSLVGPRPHDVHELAVRDPEQEPRLSMRPGLTGLWQVSARSDPTLASRVHHDLHYINHWSLLLDAKILAKTVPAVVLGRGGSVDVARPPADLNGSHPPLLSTNGAHPGAVKLNGAVYSPSPAPESTGEHTPAAAPIAGHVDVAAVAVGEEGG
jgi:lipopolysaccharide/colanic/teichoic acid biosynthesis glycosyltransferase